MESLFLLTCTEVSLLKIATRWQQRPAFGTHTILYRLHQKFCSLFTIRCHDRDSFHFLPNNRTEQLLDNVVTVLFHCPLPLFTQFHCSIIPQHCSLSDQGTVPGVFCSLPGKGNFSPIREIHKDQTKGSCKGASSGEDCG